MRGIIMRKIGNDLLGISHNLYNLHLGYFVSTSLDSVLCKILR